ncbi:hypothetical protein ANACOL_01088 [Anaerotruncus colihominis DSM 17241]|uniref:Uncharacterized protein n=1 Tax=Anaerotruncus colihominis DSM 17241 TaxID=445972 RepID=B0P8K0_9FIRM|nr:hypothetical protein ANACOL_01088 [Anaerotruncus colihominis DSM 17241]
MIRTAVRPEPNEYLCTYYPGQRALCQEIAACFASGRLHHMEFCRSG